MGYLQHKVKIWGGGGEEGGGNRSAIDCEPPKFKTNTKILCKPPSPPAPVLHSPPKGTAAGVEDTFFMT